MNDGRANCVLEHRVDPDRPRRAVDGRWICDGHMRELEQLIAEMPARADDLECAGGGSGPRPPGSHSELVCDDRASAHRSHMTAVVASWCRVVAEDRGIHPPPSVDLYRTCPWLLRHVEWCAGNRWVDEMLLELREVTRRARSLTDIPARRVPDAAPCLKMPDGQMCDGMVTIVVRGSDWTARCSACEEVQDATPYLKVMREGLGVLEEDVITIAAQYGIVANPDVIRQWRHRGHISARTIGETVLYDLASVTGYLARRKAQAERVA